MDSDQQEWIEFSSDTKESTLCREKSDKEKNSLE